MPTQIPLRAVRPLVCDGQALRPGDEFFTSPICAAALVYRRLAEFVVADAAPRSRDNKRRMYRRRDMRPES